MLFLDEPTSGLDSTSSRMVTSALQEVSSCLHCKASGHGWRYCACHCIVVECVGAEGSMMLAKHREVWKAAVVAEAIVTQVCKLSGLHYACTRCTLLLCTWAVHVGGTDPCAILRSTSAVTSTSISSMPPRSQTPNRCRTDRMRLLACLHW